MRERLLCVCALHPFPFVRLSFRTSSVCGSSPLTSLARSPRFRTSRSYLACNSFIWFIIICRSSVSVSTTSILSRRIVSRAQRSSERVCESRFWTLDIGHLQLQPPASKIYGKWVLRSAEYNFFTGTRKETAGLLTLISQFGGSGKQAVRATLRAPRGKGGHVCDACMPPLLSPPSCFLLRFSENERPYLRRRSRNRDCHIDHFPAVFSSS